MHNLFKGLVCFLYNIIERCWNHIIYLGVRPSVSFIESRRTKLLNLLSLPCIPFMLFYSVLNACQSRYLLSALNLVMTLVSVAVLLLHKYRQYLSARLVLILFSVLVYTFTGLYFHNGSEFFLINILAVSILVYDNKWVVMGLSVCIISAFMLIVFMPQEWRLAPAIPITRVWSNVAVSLLFFTVALSVFKYIQTDYQQEIERQRQVLININKDKEKLFSIVAHDVRSPLATLETLLDMFRKGEYPPDQMEEAIVMLHKNVSQLGDVLDNVLRWSSRSMRGIQTRAEHFLLEPLITEVLHFFQMGVEQKSVQVDLQIPSAIALYADRDQVSVILRNLFSNALKFSYPGGVIQLIAKDTPEQVTIQIIDQGMGMSSGQVENLFSLQHPPGYSTNGERGTGLGLILCKEFTEQNNGRITVESNLNKGTAFTLFLPRGDTENAGESS
jgi:two-component system sensor histidine kinase/response regulator